MAALRTPQHGEGRFRRTARAIVRAVHTPPRALGRRIRKATHAQGAGESGLGKLIELHAVNSAGDMMITVALASTIFFSVPTGEARGRVALYLAVTLAPFALLAPIIGPLLDRIPHGRRAAMAGSMLGRALLALSMAGAVATGSLELYPAALGVLVASKAYGVVRSAVVPRLLPHRISLVKANSRVTLAGLLATGAAAPVGAALHSLGPSWPLYGAFTVFVIGTFLSFSLPHKVDSAKGERRALLTAYEAAHSTDGGDTDVPADAPGASAGGSGDGSTARKGGNGNGSGNGRPRRPGLRTVGASVFNALLANSSLRALSGFLTFFLAFMLREHPLAGLDPVVSLGVVAVAAGGGNALGTALGAWLRDRVPEMIIASVLALALAATVVAAVLYGTVTVPVVAAVAGLAQALGKLSLDALIQRDVPEVVRTSAFARSETLMQMSWVVGGAVGIALPLIGPVGMGVAGVIVAVGALATVRPLLSAARHGTPHPRVA
ncbi:Major Facilitator Superfamily protein [Streptomyces radiopugnans]|uniref:Major Facilitator Superfamily protein n=1 Tax=Streptomyces radiopugnans TaxID=403935 RepID=A0A1H9EMN7_9ACTN|nr:Major Facilitator Superfamily protein [Streptomyces radiopugnans]